LGLREVWLEACSVLKKEAFGHTGRRLVREKGSRFVRAGGVGEFGRVANSKAAIEKKKRTGWGGILKRGRSESFPMDQRG